VLGQVSPRVARARRERRPVDGAAAARDFGPMMRQEPDLVLTTPQEPVPSAMLYVPDMDAVPPTLRGEYGVYRWAANPVWRDTPSDHDAEPARATPGGNINAKP